MKTSFVMPVLAAVIIAGAGTTSLADETSSFSPHVTADGKISVPENYRQEMSFIGTWAVMGKGEQADTVASIHNVYAPAEDIAHYKETGEFPDGAILVKELLNTESGRLTTGSVSWGGDLTGWFVMVKDAAGRFQGNKLWGNGWGWSYFNADDPVNTVSTNFRVNCLGCHVPAKKTDWVFIQGYPDLAEEAYESE